MAVEGMEASASPSENAAWKTAQEALSAVQQPAVLKSDKSSAQNNNTQNTQPFVNQSWMNAHQYAGYPPPAPNSYTNYPGAYPPNAPPNMGASPRLPPPTYNQPPPGVRFTLNSQNRFQHNQLRYRPPGNRPTNAWRPPGALPPPPPPPNANSTPTAHHSASTEYELTATTPEKPTTENRQTPTTASQQPYVSASSQAANMSEWPPTMKAWVTRCFAAAQSDEDKDKMEQKLKEVITDAFARDRVNTTDWTTYPVPQLVAPRPMSDINSRLGAIANTTSAGSMFGASRGAASRGLSSRGLSSRGLSSRGGTGYNMGRGKGKRGRGGRFNESSNQHENYNRERSRSSSHSRYSRSRSRERRHDKKHKSARGRSRTRSDSTSSTRSSVSSEADFIPLHSKVSKKVWRNNKQQDKKSNKAGGVLAKRLGAKQKKWGSQAKPTARERANIQKRVARFGDQSQPRSEPLQLAINTYADEDNEEMMWDENHKIVGTSRSIEKEYLRLTSAPAASDVRPLSVLYHSLEHVKQRWREKSDYRWTCEQFKSIRQDLTVQCVRDEFTVKVYETHARVALEAQDHCEFNQCQTQLKALYSEGVSGCQLEFASYRILYYVFTANTIDMISALASLAAHEKKDPCIDFALSFRSAWSLSNYHQMLKLYSSSPKMTGYVIDMFLPRERIQALKTMVKVYRPTLTVEFVQTELGYGDSTTARDSLLKFLMEQGASLTADGNKIECKNGLNPPPAQS